MNPSSSSTPHLEWEELSGQRREFQLHQDRVAIGRRTDADIVLEDRQASRQHAEIVREQGVWVLVDLGSKRGTYVNGMPVERHALAPHDLIQFGQHGAEFKFLKEDGSATSDGFTLLIDSPGVTPAIQRLVDMLPEQAGVHSELEKIASLLDFHYYFGKAFSPEKAFHQILTSAIGISGAERGYVLRKQEGGFAHALGLDAAGRTLLESEFRASRSVVDQVTRTGRPVFMTQGIDGHLAEQESIVAMRLRAIACLPLEAVSDQGAASLIGILYLDSPNLMHSLSGLDERLLTRLAGEAGNVLEKIQLIEALAEGKRIEQELAVAEETQRTLMPASLPEFEPFKISAFCRATRQLGGDFYDVIPLANEEFAGMLGDVSGKGIPAALLASLALGALNMEFRSTTSAVEALQRTNRVLIGKLPPYRFLTLFLFQLDAAGKGQYLSAGHNPAFQYRAQTGMLERLAAGGLPLGIFADASYSSSPLELQPGDILLVYSDGLTEAVNCADEEFGEDRLRSVMAAKAPEGIEALRAGLLRELNEFTKGAAQNDDITFLLVENGALQSANS